MMRKYPLQALCKPNYVTLCSASITYGPPELPRILGETLQPAYHDIPGHSWWLRMATACQGHLPITTRLDKYI